MPGSAGIKPCTELETRAGTWRYDVNKSGQTFSPAARFATRPAVIRRKTSTREAMPAWLRRSNRQNSPDFCIGIFSQRRARIFTLRWRTNLPEKE